VRTESTECVGMPAKLQRHGQFGTIGMALPRSRHDVPSFRAGVAALFPSGIDHPGLAWRRRRLHDPRRRGGRFAISSGLCMIAR